MLHAIASIGFLAVIAASAFAIVYTIARVAAYRPSPPLPSRRLLFCQPVNVAKPYGIDLRYADAYGLCLKPIHPAQPVYGERY